VKEDFTLSDDSVLLLRKYLPKPKLSIT